MIPESLYEEAKKEHLTFRGYKKNNRCKVILNEDKIIYSTCYTNSKFEFVHNNDHWTSLLRNRKFLQNMETAFKDYRKEYDLSILQDIEKGLANIDPIYFTYRAKSFILEELEEELLIAFFLYMRKRNFELTKEDKEFFYSKLKKLLLPCLQNCGKTILFEKPELCFSRIIQHFDDLSNELKKNEFLQKHGIWTTPLKTINSALNFFDQIVNHQLGKKPETSFRSLHIEDYFAYEFNGKTAGKVLLDDYFANEIKKTPENGLLHELAYKNQELFSKTFLPSDNSNAVQITIDSYLELILLQMSRFLNQTPSPHVAICINCGEIFIGGHRNKKYCTWPSPQDDTKKCDEVGKKATRKKKETEDLPGLALYNTLYSRMHKRVQNTDPNKNTDKNKNETTCENAENKLHKKYLDDFNEWAKNVQLSKERYEKGEITQEEFEIDIKKQYEKITGEKANIQKPGNAG